MGEWAEDDLARWEVETALIEARDSGIIWQPADTVTPKIGETYLVWTDGETTNDDGIGHAHLWPADTLQMYLRNQIPNWRPLYVALVTKP